MRERERENSSFSLFMFTFFMTSLNQSEEPVMECTSRDINENFCDLKAT